MISKKLWAIEHLLPTALAGYVPQYRRWNRDVYVAGEVPILRISDGESHCSVTDPANGTVRVPLVEIGMQGALLKTDMILEANAYIDIKLALKGGTEHPLFAHVVSSGQEGLRLRWVFFDPGDEGRLRSLIEDYPRSGGKSDAAQSRRTIKVSVEAPSQSDAPSNSRRLVRPKTATITPFSDDPPVNENKDRNSSQRVGTRRVLKAGGGGLPAAASAHDAHTPFGKQIEVTPFGGTPALPDTVQEKALERKAAPKNYDAHPLQNAGPGEDSRSHIVIQPTAQFEKIPDERSHAKEVTSASASVAGPSSGTETPDETSADGKAKMVRSGDGRMDIGASIRSHAKTIRASELAARHDRVRVLNMATIKALIQEAVEEAATHLTASMGENERKRLLEEAEEGFKERMKMFEAEKLSADVRAKKLVEQLERAQTLLEEERKRQIKSDQFTMSVAGIQQLDEHFEQMLGRSIAAGRISPQLEAQLKKLFSHILDQEREKIREKEMEAQNAKIALLEKKIGRLSSSLEDTEKERDHAQRLASLLEKQGGALRNVFEAGLKDEDSEKERKLALMQVIFDENRKLRENLGIPLHVEKADPAVEAVKPAMESAAPPRVAAETTEGDAAETPAEPTVNPDDEPWEVKPLQGIHGGVSSSGIKQMDVSVLIAKAPPPLTISDVPVGGPSSDKAPVAAQEDEAEVLVSDLGLNPDDEPWEIKPLENASGGDATSGVKRMDVHALATKEPPPLKKR